jgi:hypothetical protein
VNDEHCLTLHFNALVFHWHSIDDSIGFLLALQLSWFK